MGALQTGEASMRTGAYWLSMAITLASVTAGFISSPARAAGFYLTEAGTPGSLGTAGISNATNDKGAAAAWSNPAAMTGISSEEMVGGMSLAMPDRRYRRPLLTRGPSSMMDTLKWLIGHRKQRGVGHESACDLRRNRCR